ncbi:MAG: sugar kinase, partial [Marinilabiliales bacterium]
TLLFYKNKIFFAPALPLEEIFDPTGSGDAFSGSFIGYLAKTKNLYFDNMKRAIIYGSAISSFCVEKFGIQRLQEITNEELNQRFMDHIELVHFDYIID